MPIMVRKKGKLKKIVDRIFNLQQSSPVKASKQTVKKEKKEKSISR